MTKILQFVSWILGLIGAIFFVVSLSAPLFYSADGMEYCYLNVVNSTASYFLFVSIIAGMSLAIFCRRREARLLGYALTLSSSIYYLLTIKMIDMFRKTNTLLIAHEYEYSFIVSAGVIVIVFSGIGLLYEWLDFRSELK